jgi:3-oxoacyl-[acyl-carrier-protein] synthase-3
MELQRATITAVGHYVPEHVMTNHDLEKMVDTNDEWIQSRTGIRERRIMKNGATSDMCVKAIEQVLIRRGIEAHEIDLIIVATVTPDMFFPATACIVQEKIGAKNAWAFDILAACSGFLYALSAGAKFIETGVHKKVLIVGADKMSSILDYTDRNSCILFGDGAGAVLLEPSADATLGLIDERLYSDGAGGAYLYMKGSGSLNPPTHETVDKKMHYLVQEGKAVFKNAVVGMAEVSVEVMNRNNLKSDDVAWLVPHQANLRIIDATAERMGISRDKVMINIDRYGNTTAATLPLCLSEWWQHGKIKRGDNLILASFGAGYTWGACYVKWSMEPMKN